MIARLANLIVARAKYVVIIGLLVVVAAATYGVGIFDHLAQGGFDDPVTDSAKELAQEREVFGNQTPDLVVLYRSKDHVVSDAAFKAAVDATIADYAPRTTTSVKTFWSTKDPTLVSTDKHATQVLISLDGSNQNESLALEDTLYPTLKAAQATGLSTDIGGPWAVYKGVNATVSADLARAEARSMPFVLLLSLLIFGSVVAAFMPGVVGAIAVLGSLAVVRLLTTFTDVSVFAINVISLLGMGLAIDYALFIVSRFREELALLPEDDKDAPAKAIRVTLDTAGRTVLFSGLTVAAAMSSLIIFPQNFLRSLGYGGVTAVLIAVIAALTILPAILLMLGRRIDGGRMPWRRGRAVAGDTDHGAWARLAHGVMRRPVVVSVVVVAFLLVIASPFLGVKWGSVDYRVLPPDEAAHVTANKLADQFGGEKSSASMLLRSTDKASIASYTAKVAKVEGVLGVQSMAQKDGVTLLRAFWKGNSQTQTSQRIVKEIRAQDPKVLVGGLTANTNDLLFSLKHHLPWMAAIMIAVMLVLLFLAFGSVVLPIKAVVMNLFSISASFGAITWIFADGHLEKLLNYTSTGFLDATQPIFMLAILVGLSMDYEVFLLSRVREQWDKTHDNTEAVAVGLQKTGRIITSAALLLGVVIGAFSMSGVVFMKMIGVGMLVALLVDATVVRALLVPATMKLLGNLNWWAPRPLARFYDRFGIRD